MLKPLKIQIPRVNSNNSSNSNNSNSNNSSNSNNRSNIDNRSAVNNRSSVNCVDIKEGKEKVDKDYDIAVSIVSDIFKHMNDCLKRDRSRVKINMLSKGYIQFVMKDNAKEGISSFIRGMYPEDMKSLLDDIERDILKRKR